MALVGSCHSCLGQHAACTNPFPQVDGRPDTLACLAARLQQCSHCRRHHHTAHTAATHPSIPPKWNPNPIIQTRQSQLSERSGRLNPGQQTPSPKTKSPFCWPSFLLSRCRTASTCDFSPPRRPAAVSRERPPCFLTRDSSTYRTDRPIAHAAYHTEYKHSTYLTVVLNQCVQLRPTATAETLLPQDELPYLFYPRRCPRSIRLPPQAAPSSFFFFATSIV